MCGIRSHCNHITIHNKCLVSVYREKIQLLPEIQGAVKRLLQGKDISQVIGDHPSDIAILAGVCFMLHVPPTIEYCFITTYLDINGL